MNIHWSSNRKEEVGCAFLIFEYETIITIEDDVVKVFFSLGTYGISSTSSLWVIEKEDDTVPNKEIL